MHHTMKKVLTVLLALLIVGTSFQSAFISFGAEEVPASSSSQQEDRESSSARSEKGSEHTVSMEIDHTHGYAGLAYYEDNDKSRQVWDTSRRDFPAGQEIQIVTVPDSYCVGDVTVMDSAGRKVDTTFSREDYRFTFTMPPSDVQVNVSFREMSDQERNDLDKSLVPSKDIGFTGRISDFFHRTFDLIRRAPSAPVSGGTLTNHGQIDRTNYNDATYNGAKVGIGNPKHQMSTGRFKIVIDGTVYPTGYCMNPLPSPPAAGDYTYTALDNNTVRRVLYYGYGGPGDITSGGSGAMIITHLAVSQAGGDPYWGTNASDVAKAAASNLITMANSKPEPPDNFKAWTFGGKGRQNVAFWTQAATAHPFHVYIEKANKSVKSNVRDLSNTVFRLTWYDGQFSSKSAADASGAEHKTYYMATTQPYTSANGKAYYWNSLTKSAVDAARNISSAYTSDSLDYDSSGVALLNAGTIVVEEVGSSAGYKNDNSISLWGANGTSAAAGASAAAVINFDEDGNAKAAGSGASVDTVWAEDDQVYGGAYGVKSDYLTGNQAEGNASLEGAEFTVRNANSYNVWSPSGDVVPGGVVATLKTDASGNFTSGNLDFGSGSYTVEETKAPAGYHQNTDWKGSFTIPDNAGASGQMVAITGGDGSLNIPEKPFTGGGTLLKLDHERETNVAQGDGRLGGAVFSIYNISRGTVARQENGNTVRVPSAGYTQDLDTAMASVTDNNLFVTMTTDENGNASTGNGVLPYGTYLVKETTAPEGYRVASSWGVIININFNGQMVDIGRVNDDVIRGGVTIRKGDALWPDMNDYSAGLDLSGIKFDIRNASTAADTGASYDGRVLVNGKLYNPGEIVDTITVQKGTDGNGKVYYYATTDTDGNGTDDTLPYGTYTISERKTDSTRDYENLVNSDYADTLNKTMTFQIHEDGRVVTRDKNGETLAWVGNTNQAVNDSDLSDAIKKGTSISGNNPVRGDIHFNKKIADINTPLSTAFLLTNLSSGESHIIATDRSGCYTSNSLHHSHTHDTNANDVLAREAGIRLNDPGYAYDWSSAPVLDAAKMTLSAGTWFGLGQNGSMAVPTDTVGALPKGNYRLQELKTTANVDFEAVEFTFYVGDHANSPFADMNLGTILNGSNIPLMESSTAGSIQDGVSGSRYIYATEDASFSDEISCTNLPVRGVQDGKTVEWEYKILGELHYARDFRNHKAGEIVLDAKGHPIKEETGDISGKPSCTVEQQYYFDATDFGGAIFSVYNVMYQRAKDSDATWNVYLRDQNIENERQRIYVPGMDTIALNTNASQESASYDADGNVTMQPAEGLYSQKGNGAVNDHIAKAGSRITVTDTVHYSNLLPNRRYTLKGYIVPKGEAWKKRGIFDDAHVINVLHGEYSSYGDREHYYDDVAAQASFLTPDGGGPVSGSQEVCFTFDVDPELEGQDLVVFEELRLIISGKKDTRIWSTHEDVQDKDQQIKVPSVKTKAFDALTGDDVGVVGEKVTLSDTISYKNVVPGRQYRVEGSLVNKKDGSPITDRDGKQITAAATFTADAEDGEVTLDFTVPSSMLRNKTINVYEDLIHTESGVSVAEHMDISDHAEDVHYPDIRTSASDRDTGDHAGSIWGALINGVRSALGEKDADGNGIPDAKQQNIIDIVTLTNLVPGRTYTVSGKLYDEATGEALVIDGKEITQKAVIRVTEDGKIALADGNGENITVFDFDKINNDVDGTIDLVYALDSSKLANKGTTIVVFEDVFHNDVTVVSHHDIKDRSQAVNEVEIHTTAVDSATTDQTGQVPGENTRKTVTIDDTVNMAKLVKGYTYTVTGYLADQDKSTADKPVYFTDASGKEITSTVTFKADENDPAFTVTDSDDLSVSGTVHVTFDIDNELVQGKTLTVFENLYHNGVKISTHSDITDASQSVYYLTGKTNLTDDTTAKHSVIARTERTITDNVYFENLTVGKEYTLSGQLMYQSDYDLDGDGKADVKAGDVLPDDGAKASVTFTASEDIEGASDVEVKTHADGTQTISGYIPLHFTIDASRLAGTSIVAAETTSHNGVNVFVHKGIDDLPETVKIPKIGTSAKTGKLDETAIYNTDGSFKDVTITDTVKYENLWTPALLEKLHKEGLTIQDGKVISIKNPVYDISENSAYVVKGILVDKESGDPIADNNGKEYVSYTAFTPDKENGSVDVTFTLNPGDFTDENGVSALEGKSLTVYEDLYNAETQDDITDDNHLAEHRDTSDNEQDIRFPKGRTHANDGINGTLAEGEHNADEASANHEVEASKEMYITDRISYENLHGGTKYTVTGTLQKITAYNEDGTVKSYEPAKDDNGNVITRTKEFTTDGSYDDEVSGTVDITFGPFSGIDLAGQTTTAFETISRDGQDVMVHADINDAKQSIRIVPSHKDIVEKKDPKPENDTPKPAHKADVKKVPKTDDVSMLLLISALILGFIGVILLLYQRINKHKRQGRK